MLLYDAKCGLCKSLALEVRSYARKPIELVALSDPEASRILSEFYPDGWSHDFYVVEDGTCRKGARALPKLARIVGARRFASLVGDYATYKRHSEECGQGADHEPNVDHGNHENPTGVSRRSFTSMMGAGAFSLAAPLSRLTSNDERPFGNNPPKDLSVHVAEVTPDGNGGFGVSLQRRPDLVLSEKPTTDVSAEDRKDNNRTVHAREKSTLAEGALNSGASFQIRKVVNEVEFENPDPKSQTAMRAQGGDDHSAQLTTYGVASDHQRFTASIHAGRGPVISAAGEPTEMTTMTGTIEHDIAQPVIDFVWVDAEDLTLSAHVDAYAIGVGALRQFYSDHRNADLTSLYDDIEGRLQELQENIDASIDEQQLVPASNQIAISGLPGFQQFAKPPEESQPIVQNGLTCSWGCALDTWCCGIGPGCGICESPCDPFGGCCVVGFSCGYYCCA